jgi:hypothetical protein
MPSIRDGLHRRRAWVGGPRCTHDGGASARWIGLIESCSIASFFTCDGDVRQRRRACRR